MAQIVAVHGVGSSCWGQSPLEEWRPALQPMRGLRAIPGRTGRREPTMMAEDTPCGGPMTKQRIPIGYQLPEHCVILDGGGVEPSRQARGARP
ncbi:hypothetical protein HD597_004180 [Nonomuraea thailandensis]|uniref:Uncharacterized protein n=1 Tax=Nonomuraea thailandensis TaxID=1188745 RepID=A0A9X2K2J7_9ACTN|nr:hypothetical protein [Nonomuraea thailandensis]